MKAGTSFLQKTQSDTHIIVDYIMQQGAVVGSRMKTIYDFVHLIDSIVTLGVQINRPGGGLPVKATPEGIKAALVSIGAEAGWQELVAIAEAGMAFIEATGYEPPSRPQQSRLLATEDTGAAAMITPTESSIPGEPSLKGIKIEGASPLAGRIPIRRKQSTRNQP